MTSGLFGARRVATIFLYAIHEEQIYISATGNICLHADHQRKLNSKQNKYKHRQLGGQDGSVGDVLTA